MSQNDKLIFKLQKMHIFLYTYCMDYRDRYCFVVYGIHFIQLVVIWPVRSNRLYNRIIVNCVFLLEAHISIDQCRKPSALYNIGPHYKTFSHTAKSMAKRNFE